MESVIQSVHPHSIWILSEAGKEYWRPLCFCMIFLPLHAFLKDSAFVLCYSLVYGIAWLPDDWKKYYKFCSKVPNGGLQIHIN